MMGIGFTEMVVIAGIALVVIGPEKFPDFAKLVMRTIRDLRGYMDEVKAEVGKELKPLRKELDTLSRIDPEKYIDSLTAEVPEKKPAAPVNPYINEEDQKVMAVAEAEAYGENPYAYQPDRAGQETAEAGAAPEAGIAPEGTVGYGEETVEAASSADTTGEDDAELEAFKDRSESDGSGEPDPWTGR